MLKVYDFMVENFNPPNTSLKRNQKQEKQQLSGRFQNLISTTGQTLRKKVQNLNILKYIFLQSKVDKVGDRHGMSLIRMTYRIITTQVYIWETTFPKF